MPDGFKNSHFSWNELMTNDIEKAKIFYGELFAWTMVDMPMEGGQYTMAQKGDERAAGMMAMPKEAEGAPPHWGSYVTVEDVDASAKKAEGLGATIIVPPTDIPGVGRFCLFQDPQGATLSMITYTMSCED